MTPECRLEVSRRLRDDFDNGEDYLAPIFEETSFQILAETQALRSPATANGSGSLGVLMLARARSTSPGTTSSASADERRTTCRQRVAADE